MFVVQEAQTNRYLKPESQHWTKCWLKIWAVANKARDPQSTFHTGSTSLYFIWTSVCLLAVTNHINSFLLTIMSCKALSVSKRCPDKSSSPSRWRLINKCPSVTAHQTLVWANRILHHVQSARRQCVNTSLLSRGKLLRALPFHSLIHTPKPRATLLPKLLLRACRWLDMYSKESRAVVNNLPIFTRRLLVSWNQSTPQRNKGPRFNPLKQLYTQHPHFAKKVNTQNNEIRKTLTKHQTAGCLFQLKLITAEYKNSQWNLSSGL